MKAIYEYLEISAKNTPRKIAIIEGNNTISYEELLKKTKIVSENIKKKTDLGQVISLLSENSIEFIIAYFGIMMSGNIVHLIPPNSSEKQILYQIQQVNPFSIFCSETMKKKIARIEYKHEIISSVIKGIFYIRLSIAIEHTIFPVLLLGVLSFFYFTKAIYFFRQRIISFTLYFFQGF